MTLVTDQTRVVEVAALLQNKPTLVLSGAGISTDSGIPDYRGPNADGSPRAVRSPMRYQEFIRSDTARQRYWARSSVGWQNIQQAKPNQGHHAVAALEQAGLVSTIITQNVDGLHQEAGSSNVLELHGSLHWVRCLDCGELEARESLQHRLLCLNPLMEGRYSIAPDGDADIGNELERNFLVADCLHCDGVLKPDVVFFGENVPPERITQAWENYNNAEAILVLGSSLTVYSGYRFVHRAAKDNKPIVIVNDGETRGDDMAQIKTRERLGDFLTELAILMKPR